MMPGPKGILTIVSNYIVIVSLKNMEIKRCLTKKMTIQDSVLL